MCGEALHSNTNTNTIIIVSRKWLAIWYRVDKTRWQNKHTVVIHVLMVKFIDKYILGCGRLHGKFSRSQAESVLSGTNKWRQTITRFGKIRKQTGWRWFCYRKIKTLWLNWRIDSAKTEIDWYPTWKSFSTCSKSSLHRNSKVTKISLAKKITFSTF